MADLIAIAAYVASKTGKTGLTPKANIYSILRVNPYTIAQIGTNVPLVEIGDGGYRLVIAGADLKTYVYFARINTPDVTVDQQDLFAMWVDYSLAWATELINLDVTISSRVAGSVFTGITNLANWLRGLFRKDAMNVTAKAEINSGGGAFDELTDSLEAMRDNIGNAGAALGSIPSVDVGSLSQAALAQFITDDTGETSAVAGSVAELSKADVTAVDVGSLSQFALAQFANEDTGETLAVSGSVAQLSQCNASGFPAGSIEYTYTVYRTGAIPLEGADVWISTDALAMNIIWRGESDAFGVIRDLQNNKPWLDPGVYWVFVQKSGYTPSTESVIVS